LHKEPRPKRTQPPREKYAGVPGSRKGWTQQFTDDYDLSHYAWKKLVDRDGALSEKEVLALFESDVREAEEADIPTWGQ